MYTYTTCELERDMYTVFSLISSSCILFDNAEGRQIFQSKQFPENRVLFLLFILSLFFFDKISISSAISRYILYASDTHNSRDEQSSRISAVSGERDDIGR